MNDHPIEMINKLYIPESLMKKLHRVEYVKKLQQVESLKGQHRKKNLEIHHHMKKMKNQ